MKLGLDIASRLLTIALTVVAGTLLTATMVRLAPGFDVDVRQLDSRLSHESREALRGERSRNADVLGYYGDFLRNASHGDFGRSVTLNRPVRELVCERLPVTLRLAGWGLMLAWIFTAALAFSAALFNCGAYDTVASVLGSFFLCVPAAAVAVLTVVFHVPAALAIAVIVFPRLFRYVRNLLARGYAMPHIVTARAKGLGPIAVLTRHVFPVCAAPVVALIGISVSVALGASVAVEALCGVPGIGQLAWHAALGRDLPVLVTVTMVVTVVILLANTISDVIQRAFLPATT
jgi:peptide/nickel transport system permease protein